MCGPFVKDGVACEDGTLLEYIGRQLQPGDILQFLHGSV